MPLRNASTTSPSNSTFSSCSFNLTSSRSVLWKLSAAQGAADNPSPRSQNGDVGGLRALRPLRRVELDLVAVFQRLEAAAGDGAEMDEQIVSTAVRRDEAESLRIVEPLHSSGCHE